MDGPIIYILICVFFFSVYFGTVCYYYKKTSPRVTNYDSLVILHRNCYSFNAKHNYLIKLIYGRAKKKFFFLTTILLEFFDENNRPFMSLKIPPQVLFDSQKQGLREGEAGKTKLLTFLLQTKISLSAVSAVRISHNSKVGELFVCRIRLINLVTNDSSISEVHSWIRFLPIGTQPRAQIFAITSAGHNVTDIKPPTELNFVELCLFFYFGLNWISFHTQYLIISSTQPLGIRKNYDSIPTMVITAFVSSLTAVVLVIVIAVIYYALIKKNYSQLRGIGFIWALKWSFLITIFSMGFILGLIPALKTGDTPSDADPSYGSKSEWKPSTLKWFALIISYIIYSLAIFSLCLCCHYTFGVFYGADAYGLRSEDDKSFKSFKTVSPTAKSLKTDSTQSLKGVIYSSSGSQRKSQSNNDLNTPGSNFRSDLSVDDKNKT